MKNTIITTALILSVSSLSAFTLNDISNVVSKIQTTPQATPAVQKTTQTTEKSNDLTSMLTSQLGVTDKQASGGIGSILSYAQSALPKNKYTALASAIPNSTSLLAMAPKSTDSSNGLGAMAGALGGASSLGGVANLASQFSSLGLDSSMISKFIPIITNYLKSSGSGDASSILSGLF